MAENMIKFLRGNVASLPQTATAGAVYFTKDEGLYLGLEDGSYHRYGDFITVADVASLPSAGAHETCMYYCELENVLAKWDGSAWVQINKQKTLSELGGVAKSVYEAKMAALEKADTDNATAISGVDTRLKAAEDKLKSVATTEGLGELTDRVDAAESDIDALQTAITAEGSVGLAIADAKKAGTDAQDAADAAQSAADKAQGDVNTLAGKVGDIAEGSTVAGLISAVDTKAGQGIADAATAQAAAEAAQGDVDALEEAFEGYKTTNNAAVEAAQSKADQAYDLANGKATMDQVNTAIANAGHAVKDDVDQALADIEDAYIAADSALETKLQGKIDEKVAQTVYDEKVAALVAEDARIAGLVSGIDTAYKAADEAQVARIATLEGKITGLSGAMHFKGVKDEIPADVSGYVDGDVIIVGEKEYVCNDGAFVEFGDVSAEGDRIKALEDVVGKAAEGENSATGLVKSVADNAAAIAAEKERAEGEEAKLAQADATNLQAAKDYADAAVEALNIADYAKQTDLDKATGRISAVEGKMTTAEGKIADLEAASATHAAQADLDAHTGDAVAHITAAERTAWNAAEGNAKTYADSLKTSIDAAYAAADDALKTELEGYADTAEADAVKAAKEYTDAQVKAEADKAREEEGKLATAITTGDEATLASAKTYAENQVKSLADGQVKTNTDAIATKANAADVYAKTETFNKDEINALLTWGSF